LFDQFVDRFKKISLQ